MSPTTARDCRSRHDDARPIGALMPSGEENAIEHVLHTSHSADDSSAKVNPAGQSNIDANPLHTDDESERAKLRFAVALAHLTALAGMLHVAPQSSGFEVFDASQIVFASVIVVCSIVAAFLSPGHGFRRVRGALLPCLSLPPWDETKTHAWFPGLGWRTINDELRADVDKRFAVPMVVIAIMVLPLFGIEHFLQHYIETMPWLAGLVATASAAVWASFTFEFIICCSIAPKKLDYVKRHWLDAIIILLPLIAFLRMARLARLAKIQKTARVFRLRGVAMRLWQAVVIFELIERVLFPTTEKRLAHLEKKRTALLEDLGKLDKQIEKVRQRQADENPED